MTASAPAFCAIDFGTSNSAIAIPTAAGGSGMQLVPLEGTHLTMPTAVFYCTDTSDLPPGVLREASTGPQPDLWRCFGRAAVRAYIEGYEGRLMRSMKSILGTALVEQTTELGNGSGVRYIDIITGYLRHLRTLAETRQGSPLSHVVLGRPVYFVDDDAARDAQAQASLEQAARAVGFTDVAFQFEPIAAAFDFEQHATREQIVLVADIGGGTSDFSVVRVGPERAQRIERRDDILASHGVHIAGTDFDRRVSLASIMPLLGHGTMGVAQPGEMALPISSRIYIDLATWHLINTLYQPARVAEVRALQPVYANPVHHQRLLKVLTARLGHALAGQAEAVKIAVAEGHDGSLDLTLLERDLHADLDAAHTEQALHDDIDRIVACAQDTVRQAGLQPQQIDALYFTGGSTGLALLTDRLQAAFATATPVRGDRLASVATGLGLHAARLFG